MSKPLIFITNDDGIHAKGIAALIEMVEPLGRLIVVAPEEGNSGMSQAITVKVPLRLREVKRTESAAIYACNGTPADCVKLAMSTVLLHQTPDLLVSGINHGSNASISVLYSGTLAAAAEGHLYGIPSVGFSLLDHSPAADFSGAIAFGRAIVKQLLATESKPKAYLNINIPNLPVDQIKGVRVCRQTKGCYKEEYEKRIDPHGGIYYWLTGKYINEEPEATDTDEYFLSQSYVSVVPIQPDMTAYSELDRTKELLNNQ